MEDICSRVSVEKWQVDLSVYLQKGSFMAYKNMKMQHNIQLTGDAEDSWDD
jgi:hypothetical protein